MVTDNNKDAHKFPETVCGIEIMGTSGKWNEYGTAGIRFWILEISFTFINLLGFRIVAVGVAFANVDWLLGFL